MPGETPEKGDKVSWNWGGGAPGGKVAETKEHGEIAIQSKRGNTIKKKAEPGNSAVHVERSGNDVVKKASELNVEEKASGSNKKREHKDDEAADGPITENADGKDVKKQKTDKKSTKTDKKNTKAAEDKEKAKDKKIEKEEEEKKDEEAEAEAEAEAETLTTNKKNTTKTNDNTAAKKKAPGRPKGTAASGGGAKKAKKDPKPRSAEGIGSRTRSRA